MGFDAPRAIEDPAPVNLLTLIVWPLPSLPDAA